MTNFWRSVIGLTQGDISFFIFFNFAFNSLKSAFNICINIYIYHTYALEKKSNVTPLEIK